MPGIYDHAKRHVVDSLAVSTAVNPIYALLETQMAGMNNDVAIKSRLLGTALTFSGFGRLYSKGRDISQRIFNVTKETSEKLKSFHDVAYCVAFNLLLSPPFYYAAGSRDFEEIAKGTAAACAVGFFSGAPLGYSIDVYRDLTGLDKSERLPHWASEQDVYLKRAYAVLAAAASVGTLAVIYYFNR